MKTKTSLRAVSIASLVALACSAALGAAACAGGDPLEPSGADDAGNTEAATPPPDEPVDAGSADADASTDAGPSDAATSTCSLDDFCHTVLPKAQVLRDVWGDGTGIVWAVTDKGSILRWDGSAWSFAHTIATPLHAIWGSSPTDLWAGGEGGLLRGTGATPSSIVWTAVPAPGDQAAAIVSIWGTGPDNVWAAGRRPATPAGGRVLQFDGQTWALDPISSLPRAFMKLWGTSASEIWVGADVMNGISEVYRRSVTSAPDAGASWSKVTLPNGPRVGIFESGQLRTFQSGGATTPDDVWIFGGGDANHIRQTFNLTWRGTRGDGGVFDWTVEATATRSAHVRAIRGTSRNDAWSAGEYGGARHWDGSEWTQARITLTGFPLTNTFYGTWGDADEQWFVGDNIALRKGAQAKP